MILLTHGHGDHLGDTVDIAKRTGAHGRGDRRARGEIEGEGVENVLDPNFGGTVKFDWGWVKLVPAWHTAVTPERHAAHARRPADPLRRQARSTTSATPRCSATCS